MAPLPLTMQTLIDAAWQEVVEHPEFGLRPITRRQLYLYLQSTEPIRASSIWGWAALLTAQRVLPLFEQRLPNERLPSRLVTLAERVLLGRLPSSSWRISISLEHAYHATGNFYGYDEDELDLSTSAWCAGAAAYHALREVCGSMALRPLNQITIVRNRHQIATEKLTDIDIGFCGQSDAAGMAALVYATLTDNRPELTRCQDFWSWWLRSVIPEAWHRATAKAAQPALAVDAARGDQDRGDFTR